MSDRIEDLHFDVTGQRCAAWLHLPTGAAPHPCAVLLHSTAGIRQLSCYSERGRAFAAAGVAVLQFDSRCFGASGGEPRQLLDVRAQAEELRAALAFAATRPELDSSRLALWGGSAGCGVVIAEAIRHGGVAAVVCLTPFVPGRETQRSAGTPVPRLAVAAIADRMRILAGREPRGVRVGGGPGETAILVREEAAERERSMLPPQAQLDADGERAELDGGAIVWENRVVLRPRLRTPNPLRLAPRLQAPLLVVCGSMDQLCPAGPARKLAKRAPAGVLEEFESGHFDLYEGASVAAEAHFLATHLSVPAEPIGRL